MKLKIGDRSQLYDEPADAADVGAAIRSGEVTIATDEEFGSHLSISIIIKRREERRRRW
jgi:hypothetical protein